MKKYIKPTIELVELKPEERLAASGCEKVNHSMSGAQGGCSVPNSSFNPRNPGFPG
jgi:hypothetical protein